MSNPQYPRQAEPIVLWTLDKAGYEVSDAERRIFAMLTDERRWFDRCAKLFTDMDGCQPSRPPR